jgi:beta-phosphoglucomutase-like phosphatase (HAD superfamily)
MIDFEVLGAIFDVDDTLLDNKPGMLGRGLHEKSRLTAIHDVGERHGIAALANLSLEDNLRGFLDAPVHSLEGAIWNIFMMTGVADSEVMNSDDPLMREIVAAKAKLHAEIIKNEAEEVPGALTFVQALSGTLPKGRMAIASTAPRSEVDQFFAKAGFDKYFPSGQIITKDMTTHVKPHPQSFNLAFEIFKLPESARRQVCAFEDDPRGILAAHAAGLYVCAITTRFNREHLAGLELPPDYIADSYQEFMMRFGL